MTLHQWPTSLNSGFGYIGAGAFVNKGALNELPARLPDTDDAYSARKAPN